MERARRNVFLRQWTTAALSRVGPEALPDCPGERLRIWLALSGGNDFVPQQRELEKTFDLIQVQWNAVSGLQTATD